MSTSPEKTPETAHPTLGKVALWFLQTRRSPQAQEYAFPQTGSHRLPWGWSVQPSCAASIAPGEREGPLRQGEQRERASSRGSLTRLPVLFLLAAKIGIDVLIAIICQTLVVRSMLNILLVDVVEYRLTKKRARIKLATCLRSHRWQAHS